MTIFYLDYENGNDSNDGSTWALAWKTITSGATAARIAPGDTIRIAKSPAPTSLGCTAAWTNLSKTVTLTTAQTATIDLCETAWTAAGDTTVTRVGVATDAKEGSYCMQLALGASPQTSILQAYYATGTLNLSAYQKISFWIKNSAAIVANNWKVCLCSDTAGATCVDTFYITAVPSTARWLPLTLTKDGGGNLGASIQSIAIYTDSAAPTASSNILVDDFIACTTAGLNLQSLISKNSAEQGGSEGWYGIQSINGTTVLLDTDTNTKANAGEGYYGTTETVTTYKRETIKTDLASASTTVVQNVMDNGTVGNNIQFQGGYDTGTSNQTGETFFDGLNGNGYGIQLSSRSYVTVNYLNVCRYSYGIYLYISSNNTFTTVSNANNNTYSGIYLYSSSSNNTFTTVSNANNNTNSGIYLYSSSNNNTFTTVSNANNNSSSGIYLNSSSNNNIFTTVSNANNNTYSGIYLNTSSNNTFTTVSNANNNTNYGIYLNTSSNNNIFTTVSNANNNTNYGINLTSSNNNIFTTVSNANNNTNYGIYLYTSSSNNTFKSLSTTGNGTSGIYSNSGWNYFYNAIIGEGSEVTTVAYTNLRVFSHNHDNTTGNHWIFTDGGTINAQATTRHTASGIAWTLTPAAARISTYPLDFKVAKIACAANALVTVKIWMIKGHATNIAGKLVCRGGQLAGVPSDVTATKADDTNWEELTITFTPTEAGVVEIEAWAYYVAGVSTVTVDDMTISQA